MTGCLLQPRFRVTEYVAVTGSRYVDVQMDDFQTSILLTKSQARKLAKGLIREADRCGLR